MTAKAGGERRGGGVLASERGDGHDGYAPGARVREPAELVDEPVAVRAGHGDVADDDVRRPGGQPAQSFARAGRGNDLSAACGERSGEQLRGVRVVVRAPD